MFSTVRFTAEITLIPWRSTNYMYQCVRTNKALETTSSSLAF